MEIRNKTNYTASWKVLGTEKEHIHFSYEPLENSWWLNSTETNDPYFFLHELKQGKNPEISKTQIVDTSGKKEIESVDAASLNKITTTGCLLSTKAGRTIAKELPNLTNKKTITKTPELYLENNKHFAEFTETVRLYCNKTIKIQCEYLETKDCVCLSYFTEKESNLSCHLLVLTRDGEIILDETLAEGLTGIFTETFCEIDNKIIYVKNENEIHILG